MGLRGAEKIVFVEGNTHKYVAEEGSRDLFCRRAPHGARGLKLPHREGLHAARGRAPHGARGLKRIHLQTSSICRLSRPTRGAWIETRGLTAAKEPRQVAPHTGRVD